MCLSSSIWKTESSLSATCEKVLGIAADVYHSKRFPVSLTFVFFHVVVFGKH